MSKKKVKYRLYVLPFDIDGQKEAEKARFSRANGRYWLVYTDRKLTGRAEITEEETWRLNGAEQEWLAKCNAELLAQDAISRHGQIKENLTAKLRLLEEELEKRRKGDGQE